jgi:hypothetical protein
MWPFSRKSTPEVDVSEQQAAQDAARETLAKLAAQDQEVHERHDSLALRGRRNNFGRSLEIAMELRKQ